MMRAESEYCEVKRPQPASRERESLNTHLQPKRLQHAVVQRSQAGFERNAV